MALTSDQITAQNFADFYQKILPYLNGGGMGMKLLWENSDPTSNFSAGDVTLSSSDYDMLIVMYRMTTSRNYIKSVVIPKSSTAYLDAGYFTSADNQVIYYRTLSSVDDLTVHIYNASKAANSSETMDNSVCIPYRIYGIKVYHRPGDTDIKAQDVLYNSGTVKDALDELTVSTVGTGIDIKSYTSTPYVTPNDGYVVVRSGGTVGRNIVNINGITNAIVQRTITNETGTSGTYFVRKGTEILEVSDNSGGSTYFYPLQ